MYKLCFYVPAENLEAVKSALFVAGAGRVGCYDSCCWQVLGEGQFRPLEGSQPHIGELGSMEKVVEYKVEMVCADEFIDAALTALKQTHPYEEVAFDVWRLAEF